MGTETFLTTKNGYEDRQYLVKLNNPLMGTETYLLLRF